ncbi:hypothetical protein ColTof4_05941 [Colletotrichum tofieldiae]|nr:hypothetical protein ColTof3_01117 [Colletotrichum tofieldiae]GKT73518.1 hypothetical protein ColTof4_05941 [Colletotrichum tofieldiae]
MKEIGPTRGLPASGLAERDAPPVSPRTFETAVWFTGDGFLGSGPGAVEDEAKQSPRRGALQGARSQLLRDFGHAVLCRAKAAQLKRSDVWQVAANRSISASCKLGAWRRVAVGKAVEEGPLGLLGRGMVAKSCLVVAGGRDTQATWPTRVSAVAPARGLRGIREASRENTRDGPFSA